MNGIKFCEKCGSKLFFRKDITPYLYDKDNGTPYYKAELFCKKDNFIIKGRYYENNYSEIFEIPSTYVYGNNINKDIKNYIYFTKLMVTYEKLSKQMEKKV